MIKLYIFLNVRTVLFLSNSCVLLFGVQGPRVQKPLANVLYNYTNVLMTSCTGVICFRFPGKVLVCSYFAFIFLKPCLSGRCSRVRKLPAT